jgi:DNA-binding beta-propeller fold protein YncE
MPSATVCRAAIAALVATTLLLGRPVHVRAACNIIPPAEQAYPSTLGSVTSPVATVGQQVEVRLTGCDGTAFDTTPANDTVAITFLPAGPGQPPPVFVPTGSITVPNATTLRFTMPSTPNLAGPAEITVIAGATVVADVGPLFQPHELGSTCDQAPEQVFQQFTVLPPPNDFGNVASHVATQVVATLDGSGSLVIPFDYRSVLPLGPGAPVARLLTGTTSLDADPVTPGTQPIDVPTSYVRSFTIDGRPLPPLLRATDAGNQIFGATDGAVALIRVARIGDQGVKFDLQGLRTSGGYGPIVIPSSEYTVATSAAIPLENLHSTATGVAFARNEAIEGNLNAASGDTDANDQVVQIVDVGTFQSTNTGMAAAPTHNPIVGGAALDVSTDLAAFLESEAAQNATDLNGDGDTLDAVLRVFDLHATEKTPSATLVADPFPGVNRKPVAIDGSLVYYREPLPGFDFGPGVSAFNDLVVSPDGRYLYEVSSAVVAGALAAHHLDPETGGEQRDVTQLFLQSGLDGATGITASPDSRFLFVALPTQNAVESLVVSYDPIGKVALAPNPHTTAPGLTGVSSSAVSPDGKHLYTVAAGDDAVTTFAIDPGTGVLTFVGTVQNGVGGVTGLVDPVRVAVSGDGKNVYVAAKGSSALKVFTRNAVSGVLTQLETDVDGGSGGPSLGGIADVAVSPDGANVYAIATTDNALSVFTRNPATGGSRSSRPSRTASAASAGSTPAPGWS